MHGKLNAGDVGARHLPQLRRVGSKGCGPSRLDWVEDWAVVSRRD